MACSKPFLKCKSEHDSLDVKIHYLYHGKERCGMVDISFGDLYTMCYKDFCDFVTKEIPHLTRIIEPRLSFRDEEGIYIDMTPRNFHRFVRISANCFESENAKVNIQVIEGSSPIVKLNTDAASVDGKNIKKCLFSSSTVTAEYRKSGYTSPVTLDIELKTNDLQSKQAELEMITASYDEKVGNFTHGNQVFDGRGVCGKCHLRMGHTRAKCHMEACSSAVVCGQVDKHPSEKKELQEMAKQKNKLEGECKSIANEIKMKEKVSNEITSSFEQKVHDILIDSNPVKYLTDYNKPKEGIILCDSYILKQFYSGRNPDKDTLKRDSHLFKAIIEAQEEKLRVKKPVNSVEKLLERSGVRLPTDQPQNVLPAMQYQMWSPFQYMPYQYPPSFSPNIGYRPPVSSPPPPPADPPVSEESGQTDD